MKKSEKEEQKTKKNLPICADPTGPFGQVQCLCAKDSQKSPHLTSS